MKLVILIHIPFSMKRPSQLLAWLILKPLSVACQIAGFIAFFHIEEHAFSEDIQTAEKLWAVLTPSIVVAIILTRELSRNKEDSF